MQPRDVLNKYALRVTEPREKILGLFIKKNSAITFQELEKSLHLVADRVTIYRTLKTFSTAGIIHSIPDGEGIRYALCVEHCHHNEAEASESHHHHKHNHVHFKCNTCQEVNCLDDIEVPGITLPSGYKMSDSVLLVEGVCKECNLA